jgi:excisionase family DNA binding protein
MNAKKHIDPEALVRLGEVISYLREDCYLDKAASAKYLGVGLRTFEGWMDQLPKYRPGGKPLFKRSELDEFMTRHLERPENVDLEKLADDAVAAVLR